MINTVVENGKTYANITDLTEWAENKELRAVGPDAFRRLKAQIQELGEYKPLLCTPEGIVLGGNTRLRAYKELGFQRLWVSVIPTRDKNDLLKYNLSDNDNVGLYNENGLANLLSDYELDLNNYAVDFMEPIVLADLEPKEDGDTTEDVAPEVDEQNPAKSQLGQVYQLGRHRVMCGDSTKIENVEKLMGGQKADMVFTDPPYNVAYEGKTEDRLTIQNDHFTSSDDFYRFLLDSYSNMNAVAREGAVFYVCHADTERINFTKAFLDTGLKLAEVIIWAKQHFVMGRQDYQWQHEPILYGWKEGAGHYFVDDRTQTTIWNINRPMASLEHPTMKPIALVAKAINNSSKSGENILDLFGGSGTTLLASEQTNRTCYMMELDPKYVDVIRKRYAKFIGQEDQWEAVTPSV